MVWLFRIMAFGAAILGTLYIILPKDWQVGTFFWVLAVAGAVLELRATLEE